MPAVKKALSTKRLVVDEEYLEVDEHSKRLKGEWQEEYRQQKEILVINSDLFKDDHQEKGIIFQQRYGAIIKQINLLENPSQTNVNKESIETANAENLYNILITELRALFPEFTPITDEDDPAMKITKGEFQQSFLNRLKDYVPRHAKANLEIVKTFAKNMIKAAFFLTHDDEGASIRTEESCGVFTSMVNIEECLGGATSSIEIMLRPLVFLAAESQFRIENIHQCQTGNQAHLPAAFAYSAGFNTDDIYFRGPFYDLPVDRIEKLIRQTIIFDAELILPAIEKEYYRHIDAVKKMLEDGWAEEGDEVENLTRLCRDSENGFVRNLQLLDHKECFKAAPEARGEAFRNLIKSQLVDGVGENFSLVKIDEEKLNLAAKFLFYAFTAKEIPINISSKISVSEILEMVRNEGVKQYFSNTNFVRIFSDDVEKFDAKVAEEAKLLQQQPHGSKTLKYSGDINAIFVNKLLQKFEAGDITTRESFENFLEKIPSKFQIADDADARYKKISNDSRVLVENRFKEIVTARSRVFRAPDSKFLPQPIKLEWLFCYDGIPAEVMTFLTEDACIDEKDIFKHMLIHNNIKHTEQNIDLAYRIVTEDKSFFKNNTNILQIKNLFAAASNSSFDDKNKRDLKYSILLLEDKSLPSKSAIERIISEKYTCQMFGYKNFPQLLQDELDFFGNDEYGLTMVNYPELYKKFKEKDVEDLMKFVQKSEQIDGKERCNFAIMTADMDGGKALIDRVFDRPLTEDLTPFVRQYVSRVGNLLANNVITAMPLDLLEDIYICSSDILKAYVARGGKDVVDILRYAKQNIQDEDLDDINCTIQEVLTTGLKVTEALNDDPVDVNIALPTMVLNYCPEKLESLCSFMYQLDEEVFARNRNEPRQFVSQFQDTLINFIGDQKFNRLLANNLTEPNADGVSKYQVVLNLINSQQTIINKESGEERVVDTFSAEDKKRLFLGRDESGELTGVSMLEAAAKFFLVVGDDEDMMENSRVFLRDVFARTVVLFAESIEEDRDDLVDIMGKRIIYLDGDNEEKSCTVEETLRNMMRNEFDRFVVDIDLWESNVAREAPADTLAASPAPSPEPLDEHTSLQDKNINQQESKL